ncbi:MAG: hypothetical protein ACHQ52_07465 [Candidatus Eisenbacteria bacterium]
MGDGDDAVGAVAAWAHAAHANVATASASVRITNGIFRLIVVPS